MLGMRMELRLEQRLVDPVTGAENLYGKRPHVDIAVELGNHSFDVPAALISVEDINSIDPGEDYGMNIGGMIFVSEKTPSEYRKFIAFHEMAEHLLMEMILILTLAVL